MATINFNYATETTIDNKAVKLTNDGILLRNRASVLFVPEEIQAYLASANNACNNVTGKLMLRTPDGLPQFSVNDEEIMRDIGKAEIAVKDYNAKFRELAYNQALSQNNPLIAAAQIALLDVASVKQSISKTGNTVFSVAVKLVHINLEDFVSYATDMKMSILPTTYKTNVTDLYGQIVTWRIQQVYTNTQDADEKDNAIDKLADVLGNKPWRCIEELNIPRSKKHMKEILRNALVAIMPDIPVSGRDVAFLIDCVVLGAGRDVYSIRFCKVKTLFQRVFEVLIAHVNNLDLQLSK